MIPEKGQYIKCIFRNNAIIEGIVESWSDQRSVLKTSDEENLLIIQRTADDVMIVKIVLESQKVKPIKNKIIAKSNLEKEFSEVYEQPSDNDLRTKRLAELKIMMAEQEKKIITEKLKDHHCSGIKSINYQYPSFIKNR